MDTDLMLIVELIWSVTLICRWYIVRRQNSRKSGIIIDQAVQGHQRLLGVVTCSQCPHVPCKYSLIHSCPCNNFIAFELHVRHLKPVVKMAVCKISDHNVAFAHLFWMILVFQNLFKHSNRVCRRQNSALHRIYQPSHQEALYVLLLSAFKWMSKWLLPLNDIGQYSLQKRKIQILHKSRKKTQQNQTQRWTQTAVT